MVRQTIFHLVFRRYRPRPGWRKQRANAVRSCSDGPRNGRAIQGKLYVR